MSKIYRKIYRDEVKTLGADAAYMMAEIRAYIEFGNKKGLTDADGFIKLSAEQIEDFTGFDRFKQSRIMDKLEQKNMIQTRITGRAKYVRICTEYVQKCTCNVQKCTYNVQKCTYPFYISDKYVISIMSSCITEKQQQFIFSIFDFFKSKISDTKASQKEAAEFIIYNRDTYGPDHLTPRNYKRHATAWIEASKNKPKRKAKAQGRNRSAKEAAEAAGVTVEEYLEVKPNLTPTASDLENMNGITAIINDLFEGAQDVKTN